MFRWDPKLYLEFQAERTQPSIDLVSRIPLENPGDIVDLGCGPGNSAAVLAQRWPRARISGIDRSEEMLDTARQQFPGCRWIQGDLATYETAGEYDLIFSNAAFQWVHGHARLLPQWMARLRPGGIFAMQIPFHLDSRVHLAIEAAAGDGPWAPALANTRDVFEILTPGEYYDILAPHAVSVDLWTTEYLHVLESSDAVLEWMRGTGLRPYLERLNPAQKEPFLEALRGRLRQAFCPQRDGRVLFPFPRLFVLAAVAS